MKHRAIFIGIAVLAAAAAAGEIPLAERRSGYEFMGRETRAMQDDDATNPGTLWLLDGEALWSRKTGERSCADCHGDASSSMRGVATRYPAVDAKGRLLNLEQRINECRVERQKAPALAFESRDLLALTAYVARQSRGLPIDLKMGDKTKDSLEAGRAAFHRRQGQLNLSCAQCHDERWGIKLAGNTIPQAHPTGYPIYRLEWQGMGSLQRRLRNCFIGVRAEPYAYGSKEFAELELYLMWRARGMKLESPAVRP
ncbi:MAG TPA: sulfur oxidation c-type cytochrome SoxA [Burkholderiales bacterium]|nr:sulfur oxidation c-type cytochrome SoxA [Burkholderiales bacterium]